METDAPPAGRRPTGETRARIQQTALELFTAQGYDGTSMRQIAEALGIRKASLYHHFAGKDDVLRSLLQDRGGEVTELLAWVAGRPRTPATVREAVLRWVGSASADKLRGIRFVAANPLLLSGLRTRDDGSIGAGLSTLADTLADLLPDRTPVAELHLRMALLSINAALEAAARGDHTDEQVLEAARLHAVVVLDHLLGDAARPPTGPA